MRALVLLPAFFLAVTALAADDGGKAQQRLLTRDQAVALVQAVRDADRPEADRAADARRKPAGVLGFFGFTPGMQVLDMFAGGGYYTEILSRYVGLKGRVYAQNNAAYRDYAASEIDERYRDGRLPNVQRLDVEVADLSLPAASLDAALLVLSYHDLYFRPDDGSWPRIDGPAMLAEIYQGLRPGGILGVVDHVGAHDMDDAAISKLHRIPPSRVIREIEAAGFTLEDSSEILTNPDDDHGSSAFDPAIRGNTDRFVFRFRKPAGREDDS